MNDELNPYKSPTAGSRRIETPPRSPRYPRLSRLCMVGLALSVASIPFLMALEATEDAMFRLGASGAAETLGFVYRTWIVLVWPILSATALTYTISVDRHTRWWRTKVLVAAVMLLVWLAGCGGLWLFFHFTEQ